MDAVVQYVPSPDKGRKATGVNPRTGEEITRPVAATAPVPVDWCGRPPPISSSAV